ncbi:MAG: 2-dehydropantoate 2-reductase [Casimicrobiaceae bacterium]
MRIAVMGSGGVGGYFGARLAAAGHPVAFIARGAHLAAIRARGLHVTSGKGDIHVSAPTVTDDPSTLAPVDVVLFAVKLWDTEDAARQVAPLVSGGGFVIPFQNGVESMTRVGAVVGPERVLGGTAHIAAKIGAPGVIEHIGTMARLRFGAAWGDAPPVAHELAAAFRGLDVDAEVVPDITRALWEKFAFLAAFSGITAASRQPIGVVRADPDMRAVFEAAMREAFTVGRARGVALADDYVEGQMRFADGLPQEMKSSLLHDLVAGNRLEAPWLSGAVLRMGREAGVATPVSAALYAAVKPYLEGAGR